MKGKTFLILLVVTGLLTALWFFRFGTEERTDAVKMGEKLFADLPVNAVATVTIADAESGVTLVKGDLRGIVRARTLSEATMRNIRQNLVFAFGYNAIGVPVAAGILYPFAGILLSPMIAAAAMSFSSVSVIGNALRLRYVGTD